jgi:branched-chain amino acid transport system permease protein
VLVAVGVGVLDQAVFFSYADQVLGDLVLFGIIAGVLLIQRNRSMSRAELEQASAWRADREVRPIPDELRRLPVVRSWTRNGKVLLAVLALGYPWITSTTQTATAERSIILAMVGLSILVLSGWAGQISLGQFAIAAVGGWVTVVLVGHAGFPFYFALPVAALAGGALALLIGLPALRLRGLYLAVSTLAFAVAGTSLVFSRRFLGRFLPDVINRPHLLGLDLDDVRSRYYFSLLMLTLCAVAVVGLRRSRFARVLIAARDNEQNAEAFGISVTRSRLTAFAVSGIIAALAGGVLALGQQGLDARSFSAEASIGVFLTASLGGLGAISGPMLGAVFFLAVRLLATDPVLGEFITSTGLLAVLLLLPGGLSAGFYRLRDSLLRRVAIRNRILSPALFSDNRLEAIQNPKAAIAPNTRAGGVAAFVPPRYRLDELGTKGERARPPVAAARSDS